MAKAKVQPPWRSGFCGDDMPPESHRRCDEHPRSDGVPCICPHHHEEEPVLPDPFTVPQPDKVVDTPTTQEGPGLDVPAGQPATPEGHSEDWHQHRADPPWTTGTGLPPIPLASAITVFAQAAGDLHRISDDPDEYDPDAALVLLRVLRAAVRRAGMMDALIVKHLYDHGPRGERIVDGVGRAFVHRRDAKVKWDERGTASAVVDAKMAERGYEVPDDPMEVVTWLLEAASVGYYRVTALKAMGIDPDDFRHREKGTIAVDISVPD